jgi:hypothetical protein
MDLPPGVGLHDPDDWYNWSLDLHPSDDFAGHLARLALNALSDAPLDSVGVETLRFVEDDESFEVEVRYVVEEFGSRGRVFQVLSIRSEGDPLPPSVDFQD